MLDSHVIATDGKSLRRSFAEAPARSPVHLVQPLDVGASLELARVKVDDKSNEVAVMSKLLGAIENGLHRVPDVTMNEDQPRNPMDNGPNNLALLPRLALNIARREPTNDAMPGKLERAAARVGAEIAPVRGTRPQFHRAVPFVADGRTFGLAKVESAGDDPAQDLPGASLDGELRGNDGIVGEHRFEALAPFDERPQAAHVVR